MWQTHLLAYYSTSDAVISLHLAQLQRMTKNAGKISYLDGIRGVAAFLVFFHHFLLVFYCSYYSFDPHTSNIHDLLDIKYGQSMFSFLSNGNFCVDIFFVLSGFVLSTKYFKTNNYEVLVSGTMRRFLRLYIPVASTLIIAFLMMKAKLFYNVPVAAITHSEWWFGNMWTFPNAFETLWHCLKVGTMFQGDNSMDTSLWTMSIELTGSMFVFAFLALTHGTRNRFASLLVVLLYCKITDQAILATFVMGISLNYAQQYFATHKKHVITIIATILLLTSFVLGSYPTTGTTEGTLFQHIPHIVMHFAGWFHTIGAYFLVLAFVMSASLQRFISLRVFRFLGYISFSLYLIHPLIFGSFTSYAFLNLHPYISYNRLVLLLFILTTAVALPISWLMTRYIDTPGMNFSKYIYNRWSKKRPEPVYESVPAPEPDER
jgi:peptidoglycan/LPS O-acetylase OafA/YrhL